MYPSDIKYMSKSGNYVGQVFTPHKTKEGKYIVSPDRFAKNYVYADTVEEIIEAVKNGLGFKMSVNHGPASLASVKTLIKQNPNCLNNLTKNGALKSSMNEIISP